MFLLTLPISEFHWFAANVLAALILILVGWGCGCKRHGYQRSVEDYRRHCCSLHCLDSYGCSPDCLSNLYAKCSRFCSRVRPCRRVSSSGDLSPASSSQSGSVTAHPRQYAPHMPVVSISAGIKIWIIIACSLCHCCVDACSFFVKFS